MAIKNLGYFLCVLGIGVSAYLLYAKLNTGVLVCGISSCQTVNSSKYSELLGVPVSAWGIAFYVGMMVMLLLKKYKLFFIGAVIGVLFSLYLTFLEIFVIHAWCQWCVFSAWLTVGLLIIGVRLRKSDHKSPETNKKVKSISQP